MRVIGVVLLEKVGGEVGGVGVRAIDVVLLEKVGGEVGGVSLRAIAPCYRRG